MSINPRDVPYYLQFVKRAEKEFGKLERFEQEQVWEALLSLCTEARGDIK